MHIVFFGAGGVGGNYGARIAHAGHPVTLIARGEHLKAIRENGLTIEQPEGDFTVRVDATDDASTVKNADVIFHCTKSWQLESTFDAVAEMLGSKTFIIPLQNSVDACDRLAARFGKERVVGGLCYTISHIVRPGVVQGGSHEKIIFGEREQKSSPRTEEVEKFLNAVPDITVLNSPDIHTEIWKKFTWIASAGAIGAATRAPIGVWRAVPESRAIFEKVFREVFALARVFGAALTEDDFIARMKRVDVLSGDFRTSMQRDLEAGRFSELCEQIGVVVNLAQQKQIDVPASAALYAVLLPQEMRVRGAMKF